MSINHTASANRLHIGIFGKRNSGKSTLINALTGHQTSLVSDIAGTTTDLVYKTIEIHGIGPCVLIDTGGFDDSGQLGEMRVDKTRVAMEKADIALVLFTEEDTSLELEWINEFRTRNTPVIPLINKIDTIENTDAIHRKIAKQCNDKPICISALTKLGIEEIREAIIRKLPEDYDSRDITGNLVQENDIVLLVMPQDIQAPKGRLILPQVQTIRELLDKKCIVVSSTVNKLPQALAALSNPPKLIITDSQIFPAVFEIKPAESLLTSFSVLFAALKGDIEYFTESAAIIDRLTVDSKVLIAEACTHVPLSEDIGTVKIPNLLRKKIGEGLTIDNVHGNDFPEDLKGYDLIIQCGSCMFNRKFVLNRMAKAQDQQVPMTNYGIALAHLSGILDKISS
ncbi:MAG: [FeFe] hydrogenase H-cluster maturation GTPase HydF [Clostridiales bacterium]|nr:[FeFe] hydrogenase H-cluster maturation GTPase HydF [Clostridiales bacterium]